MTLELPPVNAGTKRYGSSIPSARLSQFSPTEIPVISRKGAVSINGSQLSMHEVTDPSLIDQKLRSLSHNTSDVRINLEA